MSFLFNEILYRPLLNLLFIIYNSVVSDLGLAIIILTIVIRFVLLPIFYKSSRDQAVIQKITPRIKEIQALHKDDKQKQVAEMMAIYKEHKVNPFSGFLLILIQLPILFALYRVFFKGLSSSLVGVLYPFLAVPESINFMFLGIIDLHQKNLIIVILSAIAQYLQSYLIFNINKKEVKKDQTPIERATKQMAYIGPLLTVVILYSLPSAIGLYWLTTSVFSVIQQIVINKKIRQKDERDAGNNSKSN